MAADLSTTGVASDLNAWHELEEVFSRLGVLARSAAPPREFYRALLDECVRALAANGGMVWLRAADTFQPVVHVRCSASRSYANDKSRRTHEALLLQAAMRGEVATIVPHAEHHENGAAPTTTDVLLLAPVSLRLGAERPAAVGIVELSLPPDCSPATYRGCEQFLAAVCELAADYHAFNELRRLRCDEEYRGQLLEFASHVHRHLGFSETSYTIANEGRRVLACDRLSVLATRGSRSRLVATSGVSRIERRSRAVQRIEELAELVRRSDEPVFYADGQCDALPPIAEALSRHVEESQARHVAAIPVESPRDPQQVEELGPRTGPTAQLENRPLFVLVAEQFDAGSGGFDPNRLAEVAAICATALYNAQQIDRMPLGWLTRPLGDLKHRASLHYSRTAVAIAVAVACIAALVLVTADFTVESPGKLEPVVRRDVFAPRSGLVDEVLVAHGDLVATGQPLLRLHDPQLELDLKRVDGELETAQRQIDAVRAARTNRQIRGSSPTDAYRLSAEERELAQRLTNLRRELELLEHERDALVVVSPIAGRVLSWDIVHRLAARPVQRGEVLVTVADLSADWQLQLSVPDDRIGYVLAAQQSLQPDLPVQFRLSSDDREEHHGRIVEISRVADVNQVEDAPRPIVRVTVALDELDSSLATRLARRPGVSARAQIHCGRRPLGYVWLHDIWDTALEWLRF